jgi:hypothetical protein
MLKKNVQLEVKIGERVYTLNIPSDSPLGEVHDALFKMRSFVIEQIIEAQKVDAPKPREECQSCEGQ